jgi:hypothetical protein
MSNMAGPKAKHNILRISILDTVGLVWQLLNKEYFRQLYCIFCLKIFCLFPLQAVKKTSDLQLTGFMSPPPPNTGPLAQY